MYNTYIKYFGGYCLVLFIVILIFAMTFTKIIFDFELASWMEQPDNLTRFGYYFGIVFLLAFATSILLQIRMYILLVNSVKVSQKVHRKMIARVLRAPVNLYFDVTKFGQIMNRFSKDISILETAIGYTFLFFSLMATNVFQLIVTSMFSAWWIIFIYPVFALILIWHVGRSVNSIRETSRLFSITKSPIVSFLNESISGASTIRAYNRVGEFVDTCFQ